MPPFLTMLCAASMVVRAIAAGVEGRAMTPDQCKAARRLLRWSRGRLGRESMTSINAIAAYEIAGRMVVPRTREAGRDRVARIRRAFEAAGVEFVDPNGGADGVRLRNVAT